MIDAYPLAWPTGRPRTTARDSDVFKVNFGRARDELTREVQLLGGTGLVVSTNLPLRQDGLPYANFSAPKDPGVAVYFTYKRKQMCFACDRYSRITANLRAIALTIGALRGVARWGTGDMMEAAFTGFVALPPPAETRQWWEVLAVAVDAPLEQIERAYKALRSVHHPDRAGDATMFDAVQKAWEQAKLLHELG
jgi:hypothetical protein